MSSLHAIVFGILFLLAASGLMSAARFGRWHRTPAEPPFAAHGDVVTLDPRFHLDLAGALRGDAGAGCDVPSCAAGVRTLFSQEQRAHA
jgi:hypothetical protein